MDKKQLLIASMCLISLVSGMGAARADDIDERQTKLMDRINQAVESKQLKPADAKHIKKLMADFNKHKSDLRSASGDVLTLDNDKELDKRLNAVNQQFERLTKKGK